MLFMIVAAVSLKKEKHYFSVTFPADIYPEIGVEITDCQVRKKIRKTLNRLNKQEGIEIQMCNEQFDLIEELKFTYKQALMRNGKIIVRKEEHEYGEYI